MDIAAIEKMIEQGRDGYEARLAVGQACLNTDQLERAVEHLVKATQHAPEKTAAWQFLGQAYQKSNQLNKAKAAWSQGIEVATANRDEQAKKVMAVWLKRLG